MSLVITIVNFPDKVSSSTEATKTFTEQGGTIGRGSENNWILDDPDRFISNRHIQISCENGQYFLTDLSTNGTFINGSSEPIGKGNRIQLRDGDKFALSDYEFQISLSNPNQIPNQGTAETPFEQFVATGPFAASDFSTAPGSEPAEELFEPPPGAQDSHFGAPLTAHVSSSDPLFSTLPEETDPLAAFDKAKQYSDPGQIQSTPLFGVSHSDQADAMNQAVSWPNALPENAGIPENWDDDFQQANSFANPSSSTGTAPVSVATPVRAHVSFSEKPTHKTSAESRRRALEKANAKIQAEIELLKQQAYTQQQTASRAVTLADQTLIEAMGLADRGLSEQKITEISQTVGEFVRETIIGMMQVLRSRNTIKNEFRMSVTTIKSTENNPLKFSATIDDVLENMFIKESDAYIDPVAAVSEGFQGIAEHQLAILAGIRSAFNGVVQRFDPVTLERRFSKRNKGGLIPGVSKARNWEAYKQLYKELVDDMDDSFQYLFGYEFVQAYEDQLQRMAIERKTKSNKT